MSAGMQRRPLDTAELLQLEARVQDLVWEFTRRSLGLDPDEAPVTEADGEEQVRAVRLARAAVCRHLERFTGSAVLDDLFDVLVHRGADFHAAESVLGPDYGWSEQLHQQLGVPVRRGEHTAVVIERGQPTEPGGESEALLYEADRGPWGGLDAEARANARHAVVTENGVVRRVYRLQGWQEAGPDRWRFTGSRLSRQGVQTAYMRRALPFERDEHRREFRWDDPTGASGVAAPSARVCRWTCACK